MTVDTLPSPTGTLSTTTSCALSTSPGGEGGTKSRQESIEVSHTSRLHSASPRSSPSPTLPPPAENISNPAHAIGYDDDIDCIGIVPLLRDDGSDDDDSLGRGSLPTKARRTSRDCCKDSGSSTVRVSLEKSCCCRFLSCC